MSQRRQHDSYSAQHVRWGLFILSAASYVFNFGYFYNLGPEFFLSFEVTDHLAAFIRYIPLICFAWLIASIFAFFENRLHIWVSFKLDEPYSKKRKYVRFRKFGASSKLALPVVITFPAIMSFELTDGIQDQALFVLLIFWAFPALGGIFDNFFTPKYWEEFMSAGLFPWVYLIGLMFLVGYAFSEYDTKTMRPHAVIDSEAGEYRGRLTGSFSFGAVVYVEEEETFVVIPNHQLKSITIFDDQLEVGIWLEETKKRLGIGNSN